MMNEKIFRVDDKWGHKIKVLLDNGNIQHDVKAGFDTEADAERSYLLYKTDFEKKYHAYLNNREINTEIMFDDYLQYWFDETFCKRIEPSTRMAKSYALNKLLLPHIRTDVKLRYVTTEYINAILEEAAKHSDSAGGAAREFLYMAMKDAVIEGYILENPVYDAKSYPRKKPSIRILNKRQIREFLKAAVSTTWYLEILLCLFCGLRKGEVAGLKFSDFDYDAQTVKISRQLGVNYQFGKQHKIEEIKMMEKPPKTGNSYRVLRVPDVVINEVKKRKLLVDYNKARLEAEYDDNDYISCQENGKPHSPTAMNNAVIKLCKRNALPRISVHSLRHMYATILMEQGVNLPKISALLGHESVNTTFEYYCEIMDEDDKILNFMNNIMEQGARTC